MTSNMTLTDENYYEDILFGLLNCWEPDWHGFYIQDRIMLLKSAVNVTQEKHNELLEKAKAKNPPKLKLDIKVILSVCRAPDHVDEPCKPYIERCAVYSSETRDVVIEAQKIDKEHFSVQLYAPYTIPAKYINLLIDVRKKKCSYAPKCSKNEHINEEIIELSSISFSGDTKTFTVGEHFRDKGDIQVQLSYNSNLTKEKQLAFEEHGFLFKHLFYMFVDSEFDDKSALLLRQHAFLNHLDHEDLRLIKWNVYSELQESEHLISHDKFDKILIKLERPTSINKLSDNEKKIFWKSACRFLPSCLDVIRDLRTKQYAHEDLKSALDILSMVEKFKTSEEFVIYPRESNGWLRMIDKVNITCTVEQMFTASANEHFDASVDADAIVSKDPGKKIHHCIKLVEIARADIERVFAKENDIFITYLNINYAQNVYKAYDDRINFHLHVILCKIDGVERDRVNIDEYIMLINFCQNLHEFIELGSKIDLSETDFKTNSFCLKLRNAIYLWLEECFCAIIEKEIDADNLKCFNESSKHSTSAEKVVNVFTNMRSIFKQLSPEEKDKFCLQVLRSCLFYAVKMCEHKKELLQKRVDENFQIPSEWCVMVSNVDHVHRNGQSLIEQLGFSLETVENTANEEERNFVEEAFDTIGHITENLLQIIDKEILQHLNGTTADEMNLYMAKSLQMLNNLLEKDQTERVFNAVLNKLLDKCQEILQPLEFYVDLKENMKKIVNQQNMHESSIEGPMKIIDEIVEFCGKDTNQLIHLYYKKRLRIQQEESNCPSDLLICQMLLSKNELRIKKIKIEFKERKKNLLKYKSYLKVQLSPENEFPKYQNLRTKLAKGKQTLNFKDDDDFKIILTNEQKNLEDAIIMLSVINEDLYFLSDYAQTFVMLKEIAEKSKLCSEDDKKSTKNCLVEMNLRLTQHPDLEKSLERIKTALKLRTDDERAEKFLSQFYEPSRIDKVLKSNFIKTIADTCESVSEMRIFRCFVQIYKFLKCIRPC